MSIAWPIGLRLRDFAALPRFAGARVAAVFLAPGLPAPAFFADVFLADVFLAEDFLAEDFFAEDVFAADRLLAPPLRVDARLFAAPRVARRAFAPRVPALDSLRSWSSPLLLDELLRVRVAFMSDLRWPTRRPRALDASLTQSPCRVARA